MQTEASTGQVEPEPQSPVIPWETVNDRAAAAFTLGGLFLVASLLVPVGLARITDLSWVAGIELVSLAVLSVAAGLAGLYPRVREAQPALAFGGILSSVVAAGGAIVMLSMGAYAMVAGGALGMELGTPKALFMSVSLLMASGYGLGFVLIGTALYRTKQTAGSTSPLLVIGGLGLLLPVAAELLGRGFGFVAPEWLFLPAIGVITTTTILLGYTLRSQP
jgi:hypothetical protein